MGETMGVQFIARIGAGVNPDQMHAERVNGYDPLPVIDAFRRKKQMLAEGRGPVLLDTVTYRISGHSPSDASSYRSKEEVEHWQQADSIPAFRRKLLAGGAVARRRELESARAHIEATVFDMFQLAARSRSRARASAPASELVGEVMFSNREWRRSTIARRNSAQDLAENPRVQQIRGKIRTPQFEGKPAPKIKAYNVRDGIFEAHAVPLLHRPHHDRVRRRESRLGRRVRGLSRADRGAAVPSPVQFAHLRSGHCGRGRGLRAGRRPRGGGVDVRRFHGPRGRRDLQPAFQVAGDVGGHADHAGGAAHFRGRRNTARSIRRIGARWRITFRV